MSFKVLLDHWQQTAPPTLTATEYAVRLPVDDAARIQAPHGDVSGDEPRTDHHRPDGRGASRNSAASMPYVKGSKVISTDEHGDPVYEDAGPTSKFVELTRKHRKKLAPPAKS